VETLFAELKRYVRFKEADEAALRALHPRTAPHFQAIAEVFYDRILDHAEARKALHGGETTVGRLKGTLVGWMDELLLGPWNEDYFERRCRIGRVHVRIALPQHYMFGAMNVVREELKRAAEPTEQDSRAALDKVLDLELAIMLHTFSEDLLSAEKRELSRRAQVNEKLAAVGTLTAGLSHEIRNPLNAAGLQLLVLERRVQKLDASLRPALVEPLRLVQEEIRRLEHILRDFLQFARPMKVDAKPVPLGPIVARVLDLLAGDAERRGVRIERRLHEATALADAAQVQQVVLNICLNGIEAMADGGILRVRTAVEGSEAVITVEDTGPGIPDELLQRLFEPFFTTKPAGSGLGLAIARAIVEQHGGRIDVRRRDTVGTRFEIGLPLSH
jgi:signal transduction histidine kinase